MTRETIAALVCLMALAAAMASAWLFAVMINREPLAKGTPGGQETSGLSGAATNGMGLQTEAPGAALRPPDVVARGKRLYDAHRCSMCHAIAGAGNPRSSLDGVGSRKGEDAIREWMLGTGAAAERLSAAVIRRKQGYRGLPAEDLEALVAYLATLKRGE